MLDSIVGLLNDEARFGLEIGILFVAKKEPVGFSGYGCSISSFSALSLFEGYLAGAFPFMG